MRRGWARRRWRCCGAPRGSLARWGPPRTDIVGLCLGGTLTAMLAAYLAEKGDDRIGLVTLLNTLLDYSEPGVLGAFTAPMLTGQDDAPARRNGLTAK